MTILSFKPFYVHSCRNRRRTDSHKLRMQPHGFSVLVSPSGQDRCVNIQVATCHYGDEFSRREGRSCAQEAIIKTINARDLPHELAKLHSKIWADNPKHHHGMFDYVLRYVV